MIYPWLPSHPQHELAKRQMSGGGTVVSFEIPGGKDAAFSILNGLQLIDISNNLGDSKSLIIHPASTTHQQLSTAEQLDTGVTPELVRLSVGIEDVEDILGDLDQALEGI